MPLQSHMEYSYTCVYTYNLIRGRDMYIIYTFDTDTYLHIHVIYICVCVNAHLYAQMYL